MAFFPGCYSAVFGTSHRVIYVLGSRVSMVSGDILLTRRPLEESTTALRKRVSSMFNHSSGKHHVRSGCCCSLEYIYSTRRSIRNFYQRRNYLNYISISSALNVCCNSLKKYLTNRNMSIFFSHGGVFLFSFRSSQK